jgi:hypothetical protein
MARTYAAVLGFLGFSAAIARGIVEAQTANQTVWQAVFNLVAFGFVGLLVGRIAQWTVDDSIRSQLATQMQARPTSNEQAPRAAA